MRFFVAPYQQPYEYDRWALMDSESGQLVVHVTEFPDALKLVSQLNTAVATGARRSPGGECGREADGTGNVRAEPEAVFA